MTKHVAVYLRVSSRSQDTRSQEPDLEAWAKSQKEPVKWYREKASGTTMNRPQWNKLEEAIRLGRVSRLVVWRLDRLGRTAPEMTPLRVLLTSKGVGFVSLKEGIDISTTTGRLMWDIISAFAGYETEVRGERIRAGQAAARAAGKNWNAKQKGVRKKVTPTKAKMIRAMIAQGETIVAIAKAVGLSRPTVYSVINEPVEN